MTDHPAAVSPDAPEPRACQFRKKPVVIDAMQWTGANQFDLMRWCESFSGEAHWTFNGRSLTIDTMEGQMRADIGDWIIRGVKGEYYPCKPDIFAATYEPAAAPLPAGPTPEANPIDAELVARLATKLDVDPTEVLDEVDGLLTVSSDRAAVIKNCEAEMKRLQSALSAATRREEQLVGMVQQMATVEFARLSREERGEKLDAMLRDLGILEQRAARSSRAPGDGDNG